MSYHQVESVKTTPYYDQNPGTSGLRKKCKIYMQENYTENFLQSIYSNINEKLRKSGCLVIGGDGRYYTKEAAILAIQMAAANKVMVCKDALGSTPALSYIIQKYNAIGGLILTASHNPGGEAEDFGIKYNIETGGGAPELVTNHIFETSKNLTIYNACYTIVPDLTKIGNYDFKVKHLDGTIVDFKVRVIDAVNDYVNYMDEIFDFKAIKNFIETGYNGQPIKISIDSRNGVAGIYCTKIFNGRMGLSMECLRNYEPMPDFGGSHPDPNPIYAADFIQHIKDGDYEFGASFDGDADRCMIVGKGGVYISPSDSVAIIAVNALNCIPYFKMRGYLNGLARSMPTSRALDKVADFLSAEYDRECKCYEVPTGWKFFCNLMDAGKVDICGEESFGGGSTHIHEKDGIWVCLAWLSVLAHQRKPVDEIMGNHWKKLGRHIYSRHDYENLTSEQGKEVLDTMDNLINSDIVGKTFECGPQMLRVELADNFSYSDPVDGSQSHNQGYRIIFDNKDRIIIRLSGTGSIGATIRIYFEHYENDPQKMFEDTQTALADLISVSNRFVNIKKISNRSGPTVII